MSKKLLGALIVALLLVAAAASFVFFMENRPEEVPGETVGTNDGTHQSDVSTTVPVEVTESTEQTEPTEETINISLPTENPDEMPPEDTFGEENMVPSVTVDPDVPATTEDPDANVLPEDEF